MTKNNTKKIIIILMIFTISYFSFFANKTEAASFDLDNYPISPSCTLNNIQDCTKSDLIGILVRIILGNYSPSTPMADLNIENVEYSAIMENEYINTTYCNINETITTPSLIEIKLTNIQTGQSKTYNNSIPQAGTCLTTGIAASFIGLEANEYAQIKIELDPNNKIEENNEDNNSLTKYIGVIDAYQNKKISPCASKGDANNDGYISEEDYTLIKSHIARDYQSTINGENADVNANGYIDEGDAIDINKFLKEEINTFDSCQWESNFKMAFVLVGENENEFTAERLEKIKTIKNNFAGIFQTATNNKARMDTSHEVITLIGDSDPFANHGATIQKFYEENADDFDFISFYTTFEPMKSFYHFNTKNNITGIGINLYDITEAYGSKGRLMGVNYLGSIDEKNLEEIVYNGILHETGHQWGCYVGDNFNGDNSSNLEVKQQGIHFYSGLESTLGYGTPMGAKPWVSKGNGIYETEYNQTSDLNKYYHPFQLYFMGLLPESEYSTEYNIYNGGVTPNFSFQNVTFYKKVNVNDIINFEGERTVQYTPNM
jgi:hypothetical protein